MKIEDGSGNGFAAGVDEDNRLEVSSLVLSELASEVLKGNSYYIKTDFINLTSTGSYSAVLSLKYLGDTHIHIDSIRTCGLDATQWELYFHSSTGTIFDSGTSMPPINLNLSSNKSLKSEVLVGVNGLTVTDGDLAATHINAVGHSVLELRGGILLSKNDTIVLTCKPASAVDVCVTIIAYEENHHVG